MTRPLSEHLPVIRGQLRGAPHLLLCLDYDGTLVPIVENPAKATMPSRTRSLLAALSARPDVSVIVISGRALSDLRSRIDVGSLTYAGNHGLEISGPGLRFVDPTAVALKAKMKEVGAILIPRLRRVSDAVIEDKGLTISVHCHSVAPEKAKETRRIVEATITERKYPLHISDGYEAYDIRPNVRWNKGSAVHWIKERIGHPDALTIYVGDDRTDEDAFSAVRNGITIKVGDPSATAAMFYVEGPTEVQAFLQWLIGVTVE
ncbi:MAG: trehalose-phosphatase [Armatimonadota bacterium]